MHKKPYSTEKYRTLRLHPLSTNCLLTQITSKKDTEPHNHDCVEIFYVIQGTAKHVLNGVAHDISVGDAFILTEKDKHYFEQQSDNLLYRDILIDINYFQSVCNVYDPDFYHFLSTKEINHIFLNLVEIYAFEQSCRQLLESALNPIRLRNECIIVTSILNTFLKQSSTDPTPSWLKKLVNHISSPEEFIHPISQIVKVYPFSTSYICRTFKKHYKMTISQFFNIKKIEYSKILLLTTDYSLDNICEILGFTSVSYFCKLFKKTNGTTPSAIRHKQSDKTN